MAGQIDCVFRDTKTGELHMVDWKRCKKTLDPSEGVVFDRFGKPPCQDWIDNKFFHYVAQQNLYAAILEDAYSVQLASMSLVQLHPNQDSFTLLSVPRCLDVARQMLDVISNGGSATIRPAMELDSV